jgi:hypothetical protein
VKKSGKVKCVDVEESWDETGWDGMGWDGMGWDKGGGSFDSQFLRPFVATSNTPSLYILAQLNATQFYYLHICTYNHLHGPTINPSPLI